MSYFPYVKKKQCGGGEPSTQRVIIPQGLVNPSETTIIEIPQDLQNEPAVVARPRIKHKSHSDVFPITCSSVRNNHQFSKDSDGSASVASSQYSTSISRPPVRTRTVIETTRYTEEIPPDEPDDVPPVGVNVDPKSKSFSRTGYPQLPPIYESGVSYSAIPPKKSGTFCEDYIQEYTSIIDPNIELEDTGYDYSNPERDATSFDSYIYGDQFKKQLSSCVNLEPLTRPTPKGHQHSLENCLNVTNYTVETPAPRTYLVPSEPLAPCKNHHTKKIAESEGCDQDVAKNNPQSGLKQVLDNLDTAELTRIQKDLKDFQLARRKLLFDASNLKH